MEKKLFKLFGSWIGAIAGPFLSLHLHYNDLLFVDKILFFIPYFLLNPLKELVPQPYMGFIIMFGVIIYSFLIGGFLHLLIRYFKQKK
ncbi:MAG: hypothetical protein ACLFPJ_03165 [Candidatus Woesearchaeota archaeon]